MVKHLNIQQGSGLNRFSGQGNVSLGGLVVSRGMVVSKGSWTCVCRQGGWEDHLGISHRTGKATNGDQRIVDDLDCRFTGSGYNKASRWERSESHTSQSMLQAHRNELFINNSPNSNNNRHYCDNQHINIHTNWSLIQFESLITEKRWSC